ncbi:MAG TPA: cyclohexanecarboxylate-CoA ligase, partial [Hyphomicrobiaceae bacterium]|nr:cyclohexanecarboxylate-CoA ligase [Hyphomicrobiaceae bacterium]
ACAFIVAKPNHTVSLASLTRFLAAEGMAKPYWPERLVLIPQMPRTPSGKIQKFKLRELAASSYG